MKLAIRCYVIAALVTLTLCNGSYAAAPRIFILNGPQLAEAREEIRRGADRQMPALEQLRRDARAALEVGPFTVVSKETAPPSGDKHDYMSIAPYWWPNPNTADGMPYVRRDGERNPDIYKVRDRLQLGEMIDAVETLALAYYFTGDEAFAKRAGVLVRTWFLDPDTRMNPHLEYGQAVPGENTGRGAGLIESRHLTRVIDSVALLSESDAWTDDDQRELEAWFEKFLVWMQQSDIGRDEADADNNHGTYYDVQIAAYSLFTGKTDQAAEVLQAVGDKRIADQVEPDGRQPEELERTKAWSYSVGNLAGLMTLARLGEHVEVDLWHYETKDGRSIRAALDYLIPFGIEEQSWPYQQINGFDPSLIYPLLHIAAAKYPDGPYAELLERISKDNSADRSNLLVSPLDPISNLHKK